MIGFLGAAESATKRDEIVGISIRAESFMFAKRMFISFLVSSVRVVASVRQLQELVSYPVPVSEFHS